MKDRIQGIPPEDVSIRKQAGSVWNGRQAYFLQDGDREIVILARNVPEGIETGDVILRTLPHGSIDHFFVDDSGYTRAFELGSTNRFAEHFAIRAHKQPAFTDAKRPSNVASQGRHVPQELDEAVHEPPVQAAVVETPKPQRGQKMSKYGPWKIVSSLGEGGQAHTYLVSRDEEPETRYVLTRLKMVGSDQALARFRQEVETIKRLDHPNIIKIIDADLTAREPYFVTEYCAGGDLADWMKRPGDYSVLKALELFLEVCAGVNHAVTNGVTHRDIKPENIFLRTPDGPAVVADWGICFVEGGSRHTFSDEVVGTRFFTDPLLEEGRYEGNVPPAVDVYSLGKLLYWLLSRGRVLPHEDFRAEKWNLVAKTQDERMERINRLLDRMITRDLSGRFADAGLVEREIREEIRLIRGNYSIASCKVNPRCTYCGIGRYALVAGGSPGSQVTVNIQRFGFNPAQGSEWRILVCNVCGHVQTFRLDYAERKDWWEIKSDDS